MREREMGEYGWDIEAIRPHKSKPSLNSDPEEIAQITSGFEPRDDWMILHCLPGINGQYLTDMFS